MTKQEQIEEIQKIIDDSWEFSSISAELGSGDGDINVEEAAKALYEAGYRKEQETAKEIDTLKAENARLTTKLGQVLLSIDTVKEMNVMCNIAAQVKQAKIDVLNELKAKSYVNDYCREVVEVEKIDQMITELIK